MGAMLDRLTCFRESLRPNRRKADRSSASAKAEISSETGETANCVIGDVSAHGCAIRCEAEWLRTGRFIGVSLEGAEPLRAIVRWSRNGTSGLEFLRPVPREREDWHNLIDSPWSA